MYIPKKNQMVVRDDTSGKVSPLPDVKEVAKATRNMASNLTPLVSEVKSNTQNIVNSKPTVTPPTVTPPTITPPTVTPPALELYAEELEKTTTPTVSKAEANRQVASPYEMGNYAKNLSEVSPSYQAWSDAMSTSLADSPAIQGANASIAELESKIGKGVTKDKYLEYADKLLNQEDFSYDMSQDTLFQNALASAMASGKSAMANTMGQASALTGGYGSSYATAVASQAYNQYIQEAYNQLPEYYQMALNKYQMDSDRLYKQYGVASDMYQQEYGEQVDALNRAISERDNLVNMTIADRNALGQLVSQDADWYNSWANRDINERQFANETSYRDMAYADSRADTEWEKNYKEQSYADSRADAEWEKKYKEQMYADSRADAQWEQGYKERALAQDIYTSSPEYLQQVQDIKGSGSASETSLKEPSRNEMEGALEAYGMGAREFEKYLASLPDTINKDKIREYVETYGELPYAERSYTGLGGGGAYIGKLNDNAQVVDEYGNQYALDELYKNLLDGGMSPKEAKEYLKQFNSKASSKSGQSTGKVGKF